MVFSFVPNFFPDNARVRIFIFFPEFNIRLYDKNSESDYFFFLHQNQNIFFSNMGNKNIFLEKNHKPPFKLNGRSLKTKCVVKIHLLKNFGNFKAFNRNHHWVFDNG
jgi:hypothetical protein